ncbi:SRPBCC domain-containing protein [Micromonospora sp. DT31]|uniref:SRPBCC domain-containing protein n=1 Tax=Micromonospora sp. DT31 TaxID=3393434 RepID=UPI003CF9CA07
MIGLNVTLHGDREIRLSRDFAAGRHLVFAAFTRPELLMRWWGAQGWHLVECEVDLRVGGRWRFVSRGPEGDLMAQGGTYREIDPPARLVCTELFDDQSYPGETLVRHDFTGSADRTTVVTHLWYATAQGRDTVLRHPMIRGLTEAFDRLAVVLHTISTTGATT